jgi:hypothetical protein
MNGGHLDQRQPAPDPYTFQDERYQLEFIVHSSKLLTDKQLQAVARRVIEQHKTVQFEIWKLHPANWRWKGDIESKKDELLRLNPLPRPVELLPVCTQGHLKSLDVHQEHQ